MIYCAAFLYPTTIHGYTQECSTVDYLPTPMACHTWLVCILKQGVVQSRSSGYLISIQNITEKNEALEIVTYCKVL